MVDIFSSGLGEHFQVLIVGILIYAIIYALLTKINILSKDAKINSIIALLSAIIVSFSGVVTYAIVYAINWSVIIFFIVFLLFILLMFLGVKLDDITKVVMKGSTMKAILIAFALLFVIILAKGFFALNNTFDVNEPQNDSYKIDTSFNTGIDDITNKEIDEGFFSKLFGDIDEDLLTSTLFLAVLGIFVLVIGR